MDVEKLPMSERLLMNASLVPKCSVLADVGCDHAYTALYLVAKGVCSYALAMDIKSGPLLRAKKNIEYYGFSDRIKTRLSDGLSEISSGEADCILISGMGGSLIIDILNRGWEKVNSSKYLVLQPQSEIGKVREFLHKTGYQITAEEMCVQGGKFYTALRAERGEKPLEKVDLPQEILCQYGSCLLAKKHPILKIYITHEITARQILAQRLAEEPSDGAKKRLLEVREELAKLLEVLDFFKK